MKSTKTLKRVFSILLSVALLVLALAALTSCGAGGGTVWHSGDAAPTTEIGKIGDFYFETDTYDVWQKGDSGWAYVANLRGGTGPKGDKGEDGAPGAAGATGATGATGTTGQRGPKGDKGDKGDPGEDGDVAIKDITKIWIGYDGYIWCDGERTLITVAGVKNPDAYEDTTAITGGMAEVFPGEFLDLSENSVALMAHYQNFANKTLYSGLSVSEITVYAEEAGVLHVGTAKVSDVVNARRTGADYVANTDPFVVKAGLNTLVFDESLVVGADETIVLGGSGSVGLYYAPDISLEDQFGNFTFIDGEEHAAVVCAGEEYDDTLAVSVVIDTSSAVKEIPVVDDLREMSNGDTVFGSSTAGNTHQYPFAWKYSYGVFEGKTLTKVGIPVTTVKAIDGNQTFTLHVVTAITSGAIKDNIVASYELKLPVDHLGTSTTVKKWIYVDISDLNITVGKGQTLAFGKSGDTVAWGYGSPASTTYRFVHTNKDGAFVPNMATSGSTTGIYFDFYYAAEVVVDLEEHIKSLEAANADAEVNEWNTRLQAGLAAAGITNFSILGDSISTFGGWTNQAKNNTTTAGNPNWFGRYDVTNVNATWWMQAANESGLDILVNNSISGHQLTGDTTNSTGFARAQQLHANTGALNGTEPDIIAVYYGTNDLGRDVPTSTFKTALEQLVDQMQAQYENADIFLFTILPMPNDPQVTASDQADYNNAIKQVAAAKGCKVVDIASCGMDWTNYIDSSNLAAGQTSYSIDGTHPNAAGMDKITECFLEALYDAYVVE